MEFEHVESLKRIYIEICFGMCPEIWKFQGIHKRRFWNTVYEILT